MIYLLTGGTGSFGHRFTERALKERDLSKLIIISRDEFKLYKMRQEFPDPRMRFYVGDVRDEKRLRMAMQGVDVVMHAAAMKQIPACEENPYEAVKTNILGTQNVCQAALDNRVGKVVSLSTDKAVSPVNLYGTTKLAGEKIVIGSNVYAQGRNQSFAVVRYGNVAGSRGSVIPHFRSLTTVDSLPVTDARMTRFWMTLDDAVDIVFRAIDTAVGGEVFIPKMSAFKITDLAEALGKDWEEVGIRAGEKLHESMWTPADQVVDMGTHYELHPIGTDWFKGTTEGVVRDLVYCSETAPRLTVDDLKTRLEAV
jgi:UDP-N-acetylglucosamine 4,6-dehydratase/5-epimerase